MEYLELKGVQKQYRQVAGRLSHLEREKNRYEAAVAAKNGWLRLAELSDLFVFVVQLWQGNFFVSAVVRNERTVDLRLWRRSYVGLGPDSAVDEEIHSPREQVGFDPLVESIVALHQSGAVPQKARQSSTEWKSEGWREIFYWDACPGKNGVAAIIRHRRSCKRPKELEYLVLRFGDRGS